MLTSAASTQDPLACLEHIEDLNAVFRHAYAALAPEMRVIAPWRHLAGVGKPGFCCSDHKVEQLDLVAPWVTAYVEDAPQVRTLVCLVLRQAGYDVLEARFGDEALWVAGRNDTTIDLLLTDGVMPVMSS